MGAPFPWNVCKINGRVCVCVGFPQTLHIRYVLYTNDQMTALRADYCPNGCNGKEFGKPGQPLTTPVNVTPSAPKLYLKQRPKRGSGQGSVQDAGSDVITEILTVATMPEELHRDYGSPSEVWLRLSGSEGDVVSVEVTLVNKTSTRTAEAGFLTFAPIQTSSGPSTTLAKTPPSVATASGAAPRRTKTKKKTTTKKKAGDARGSTGGSWAMDKLGEWVSPFAVADGGSQGMSPLNTGMLYARGPGTTGGEELARVEGGEGREYREGRGGGEGGGGGSVFFRTLDTSVVKFGPKLPFPTPIHGGPDLSQGIHYLLFDNYWNTNYVSHC